MSNTLCVIVENLNGRMKYRCNAGENPAIITDYVPPLGDGEGYLPLEVFLISFATCAGGTVAPLLRKMGRHVDDFSVTASGVRRTEHPTGFETITLTFSVRSQDVQKEDMDKAIALSEEKFCPVWSMIKNNVEVHTEYTIAR